MLNRSNSEILDTYGKICKDDDDGWFLMTDHITAFNNTYYTPKYPTDVLVCGILEAVRVKMWDYVSN